MRAFVAAFPDAASRARQIARQVPFAGLGFHSHEHFEIYYFHHGKCHYFIDDKIYDLSPGDMLIMHGMTLHRPNPDPHVDYVRSVIHIDPHYMQNLLKPFSQVDLSFPFRKLKNVYLNLYEADRDIDEMLYNLYVHYRQKDCPTSRIRTSLRLIELLTFIYERCEQMEPQEKAEKKQQSKIEHVQAIVSFVEEQYRRQDLALDHIAEATYLSKHYVSRIFKEVTGASLMEYIVSKRINQSKILLLSADDMNITDVCYTVGFKHLSHFSRVFKQKVGQTAEQFRKESGRSF
jgi:AraC-like DNA-binding protein